MLRVTKMQFMYNLLPCPTHFVTKRVRRHTTPRPLFAILAVNERSRLATPMRVVLTRGGKPTTYKVVCTEYRVKPVGSVSDSVFLNRLLFLGERVETSSSPSAACGPGSPIFINRALCLASLAGWHSRELPAPRWSAASSLLHQVLVYGPFTGGPFYED